MRWPLTGTQTVGGAVGGGTFGGQPGSATPGPQVGVAAGVGVHSFGNTAVAGNCDAGTHGVGEGDGDAEPHSAPAGLTHGVGVPGGVADGMQFTVQVGGGGHAPGWQETLLPPSGMNCRLESC